jgi:hypothetical protein
LVLENCDVEHRNSSSSGGTFRGCAVLYRAITRWIEV